MTGAELDFAMDCANSARAEAVLEPETIGVKVVHLITNGLTVTCRWQKSYQTFAAAQLQK